MFSLNCKLSLQTQLKSSFYPLLNPNISPCANPMPAAMGDPEVTIVEECVASPARAVTLADADLVAFSIAVHLTSIQPLYDRNAKPATNNPTTSAAIFMTFLIAYPAAAPNRNPPPAEKRKSSTGKSEDAVSSQPAEKRRICIPKRSRQQFFIKLAIRNPQVATFVSLPLRKSTTEASRSPAYFLVAPYS